MKTATTSLQAAAKKIWTGQRYVGHVVRMRVFLGNRAAPVERGGGRVMVLVRFLAPETWEMRR